MRLGRRAIDLVGEDDVARRRARAGIRTSACARRFVLDHDARPEDVGRHEVGGELDPREGRVESLGDGPHEERLAESRARPRAARDRRRRARRGRRGSPRADPAPASGPGSRGRGIACGKSPRARAPLRARSSRSSEGLPSDRLEVTPDQSPPVDGHELVLERRLLGAPVILEDVLLARLVRFASSQAADGKNRARAARAQKAREGRRRTARLVGVLGLLAARRFLFVRPALAGDVRAQPRARGIAALAGPIVGARAAPGLRALALLRAARVAVATGSPRARALLREAVADRRRRLLARARLTVRAPALARLARVVGATLASSGVARLVESVERALRDLVGGGLRPSLGERVRRVGRRLRLLVGRFGLVERPPEVLERAPSFRALARALERARRTLGSRRDLSARVLGESARAKLLGQRAALVADRAPVAFGQRAREPGRRGSLGQRRARGLERGGEPFGASRLDPTPCLRDPPERAGRRRGPSRPPSREAVELLERGARGPRRSELALGVVGERRESHGGGREDSGGFGEVAPLARGPVRHGHGARERLGRRVPRRDEERERESREGKPRRGARLGRRSPRHRAREVGAARALESGGDREPGERSQIVLELEGRGQRPVESERAVEGEGRLEVSRAPLEAPLGSERDARGDERGSDRERDGARLVPERGDGPHHREDRRRPEEGDDGGRQPARRLAEQGAFEGEPAGAARGTARERSKSHGDGHCLPRG